MPDGNYFVHNKDYPTAGENCYYIGGEDDGVFETDIGTIGMAMCWEYIRTATAGRMLDRVDIVIGGSCWPSRDDPESTKMVGKDALLKPVATDLASLLGVPVIHANVVGAVTGPSNVWWNKTPRVWTWYFQGETQIVNGKSETLSKLSYADGGGIIYADIELGKVKGPTKPIPERFWIPEFSRERHEDWENALTGPPYRRYYDDVALPYNLRKFASEDPASTK